MYDAEGLYMVKCLNFKWPLYSVMPAMRVRIVCVEAEQKNAKQNNRTWLEGLHTDREYQSFLDEDKLVVGVVSVECVVSYL